MAGCEMDTHACIHYGMVLGWYSKIAECGFGWRKSCAMHSCRLAVPKTALLPTCCGISCALSQTSSIEIRLIYLLGQKERNDPAKRSLVAISSSGVAGGSAPVTPNHNPLGTE